MNKMILVMMAAMGFSSVAMADGFICDTIDGRYTAKVYNQTDASRGTRNGAILILSDNAVQQGRKTIASFDSEQTLADREGASYEANVDLRYTKSGRGGENFLGTKLGQLDSIRLNVAFYYDMPVKNGEDLDGQLIAVKRNGSKIRAQVYCTRYLKN